MTKRETLDALKTECFADLAEFVHFRGIKFAGGEKLRFRARAARTLGDLLRHRFRIARTAPVYHCNLAHVCFSFSHFLDLCHAATVRRRTLVPARHSRLYTSRHLRNRANSIFARHSSQYTFQQPVHLAFLPPLSIKPITSPSG